MVTRYMHCILQLGKIGSMQRRQVLCSGVQCNALGFQYSMDFLWIAGNQLFTVLGSGVLGPGLVVCGQQGGTTGKSGPAS